MFLGSNEIDEHGRSRNPQREAYAYFIETLLYYSRLFEGNIPNINEILDLEYFLYYDLIVKQVQLKKKENQNKEAAQRKQKRK